MKVNTILTTTLLLLLLQSISVDAFSQSMCYAGCSAFAITCYWVAGKPRGSLTASAIAASPTYSACNNALSACMKMCVAAARYNDNDYSEDSD